MRQICETLCRLKWANTNWLKHLYYTSTAVFNFMAFVFVFVFDHRTTKQQSNSTATHTVVTKQHSLHTSNTIGKWMKPIRMYGAYWQNNTNSNNCILSRNSNRIALVANKSPAKNCVKLTRISHSQSMQINCVLRLVLSLLSFLLISLLLMFNFGCFFFVFFGGCCWC